MSINYRDTHGITVSLHIDDIIEIGYNNKNGNNIVDYFGPICSYYIPYTNYDNYIKNDDEYTIIINTKYIHPLFSIIHPVKQYIYNEYKFCIYPHKLEPFNKNIIVSIKNY
jgi:hypothetical protein